MNESLMKFTLRIRAIVYIVGVLALLIASLTSCQTERLPQGGAWSVSENKGRSTHFWPCDWIPHPAPPVEGEPSDGWAAI